MVDPVLFPEPNPATKEQIARYFGPWRLPGTTSIGLRKTIPDLFQDTVDSPVESYSEWISKTVNRMLRHLAPYLSDDLRVILDDTDPTILVDRIMSVLENETTMGVALNEAIPQQMYEDIFIRLILSIIDPSQNRPAPHLYPEFNAFCHRLGLALIDELGDKYRNHVFPAIEDSIRVAVLSGHVGTNLKSTASAASALLNRDRFPVPKKWIQDIKTVGALSQYRLKNMAKALMDLSRSHNGRFALNSLSDYYREVVETDQPTLLVFFSDDFLESIIDLKRFEIMVASNSDLKVLFVPRCGRYGNDLAYEDIREITGDSRFDRFRMLVGAGRIVISPHGPRAGCIDPRNISGALLSTIDHHAKGHRVILETKGCRNFEMLKGDIPLVWYASFNCNRALSIRTVGIDGPPVFLRIPPGLRAYDGFRRYQIAPSPSYGTSDVKFARMTTRNLYKSLDHPAYAGLLKRATDERLLNTTLQTRADLLQITFAELVEAFGNDFHENPSKYNV